MRNLKIFLMTTGLVAFSLVALANGPWDVKQQDLKLPSQASLEHYKWAGPALGTSVYMSSPTPLVSGSPTTISVFSAQPDVPRNIVLTPAGTTAIGAGTAVVSGLNIFGKAISENYTISANQSSASTGSKAFKSVSSVSFPAATGNGSTVSVGVGSKLGLIRCLDDAGKYVFSEFGGAYDSTRGTQAISSTAVESNTFSSNSALNGSSAVDLYYIQNFRCYPN